MVCCQSSTVSSAVLFIIPTPALFTRISGPPVSLSTHSNNAATSVLVLTSATFPTTLRLRLVGEPSYSLVHAVLAASTYRHRGASVRQGARDRKANAHVLRQSQAQFVPSRNVSFMIPSYGRNAVGTRARVLPANAPLDQPELAVNWVMRDAKPSRTAQRVAMRRAAHQLLDDPKVFDDPLAVAIAGGESERPTDAQQPFSRSLRAFLAVRSRYAEDQLARAVERGVRQYVVLGAGLDTFAYRNPFRSDGPACLRSGSSRDAGMEARATAMRPAFAIPQEMTFAAVDFERQSLEDGLLRAGFDQTAAGVLLLARRDAVSFAARVRRHHPIHREPAFGQRRGVRLRRRTIAAQPAAATGAGCAGRASGSRR